MWCFDFEQIGRETPQRRAGHVMYLRFLFLLVLGCWYFSLCVDRKCKHNASAGLLIRVFCMCDVGLKVLFSSTVLPGVVFLRGVAFDEGFNVLTHTWKYHVRDLF